MKKLFLMLMLAAISLGAFAQTRQGGQRWIFSSPFWIAGLPRNTTAPIT